MAHYRRVRRVVCRHEGPPAFDGNRRCRGSFPRHNADNAVLVVCEERSRYRDGNQFRNLRRRTRMWFLGRHMLRVLSRWSIAGLRGFDEKIGRGGGDLPYGGRQRRWKERVGSEAIEDSRGFCSERGVQTVTFVDFKCPTQRIEVLPSARVSGYTERMVFESTDADYPK